MGSDIETEELTNCMKVLIWNRRFLQAVGIWPLKVFDPIFVVLFIYLLLHCILASMDIVNYKKNVDMVIANLMETLFISTALVKITLCRLHKDSLSKFLIDIEDDFKATNYRSRREILLFIRYNRLSFLFLAVATTGMGLATTTYYFRSLAINIKMGVANSSFGYQLPYKTLPIVPIDDVFTYACFCLYQMLIPPVTTFGYVGYDSFFVTLSLHVSGQLSVLNHRVKDALKEPRSLQHRMKTLIISHKRLIRLADVLEEDFNIGILQHLLISTWNFCVAGYNLLMGSSNGQFVKLIIFLLFSMSVMSTLLIYCYVGECMIQESLKFGEMLYDSEWYNISPTNLKLILICMVRSSKPLQLTSGKFFVLSLCTFTDIMKTSLGYLSVMRTFVN